MSKKRKTSTQMATAAYVSSMKNMATAERRLPRRAVCHMKYLKPGRKLGADAIFKRKQARFMTKNVI